MLRYSVCRLVSLPERFIHSVHTFLHTARVLQAATIGLPGGGGGGGGGEVYLGGGGGIYVFSGEGGGGWPPGGGWGGGGGGGGQVDLLTDG